MSALSFTKLFRSILQSTLWVSQPHHVRVCWIAMLAMADHNGVVAASIPGLASEAHVSLEECEEALTVFLSPDKYSRTKDEDGRRIVEIEGGWQLINYAKYRAIQSAEQARELTRARVQRHREQKRNGALPSVTVTHVTVGNESASTSLSTSASESRSDPDPEGARAVPAEAQGEATVWRDLKGWVMSEELRAEAIIAGVPAADIDGRVRDLAAGPIGGRRGTFDRDNYVRLQFGKWKTWGETERAKAMGAKRLEPDDKLQRQADRVSMLRAQEAAEEARQKAAQ